jgi:hypothetical protein
MSEPASGLALNLRLAAPLPGVIGGLDGAELIPCTAQARSPRTRFLVNGRWLEIHPDASDLLAARLMGCDVEEAARNEARLRPGGWSVDSHSVIASRLLRAGAKARALRRLVTERRRQAAPLEVAQHARRGDRDGVSAPVNDVYLPLT